MGFGRYPKWKDVIYPFHDRPDVGIPIVWYAVPDTAPVGPTSVFVDRNWDSRDDWRRTGVGTATRSMRIYFGPVPAYQLYPLSGTPEQWANGCSYAEYLAGRYSNPEPCVQIMSPGAVRESRGAVVDESLTE